uniref:Uncharacterized protein n=1 Tax=viral metagenome TaxID=1070528 RepID=A0A6M3XMJ4_9ZZZZ
MSEQQNDWKEDARRRMTEAAEEAIRLGVIVQMWRIVLQDDNYEAYLDACAFEQAEESEP